MGDTSTLYMILAVVTLLNVVGFIIVWFSMAEDMRPSLYKHETFKSYLSDTWDTRTASRAAWGRSLDSARAHVIVTWSAVYWPKDKVLVWLIEGWADWKQHP